ncbi:lipocalin family protein [uncultured Litoreibacter sp.]|uniref:lipocalin family protein n=1 Tax=uncultured Litoreibacter sp. TaxID=1392394 RepID=UPI002636FBD4|nr:lipocalin family protein [uncultured Litoreibacter sp.]
MKRVAAALLLAIAACAPSGEVSSTLRDVSVPITSSTRFDAARFAGDWHLVAAISPFAVPAGATRFSFDGMERISVQTLPAEGDTADLDGRPVPYRLSGPGQMTALGAALPIWVLWVDEDHRTAVIGNPQGSFGQIINRTPALRADRFRAAAEVLKFNGYDLRELKAVTP